MLPHCLLGLSSDDIAASNKSIEAHQQNYAEEEAWVKTEPVWPQWSSIQPWTAEVSLEAHGRRVSNKNVTFQLWAVAGTIFILMLTEVNTKTQAHKKCWHTRSSVLSAHHKGFPSVSTPATTLTVHYVIVVTCLIASKCAVNNFVTHRVSCQHNVMCVPHRLAAWGRLDVELPAENKALCVRVISVLV